eukprot:GHRQ01012875.1.p1 GENE.GHRQ01012875.1~~GHRQ01012875.1.p1  ORF type:complete len:224 (-),score=56.19 GHRQ01012875.1:652-1323(-)
MLQHGSLLLLAGCFSITCTNNIIWSVLLARRFRKGSGTGTTVYPITTVLGNKRKHRCNQLVQCSPAGEAVVSPLQDHQFMWCLDGSGYLVRVLHWNVGISAAMHNQHCCLSNAATRGSHVGVQPVLQVLLAQLPGKGPLVAATSKLDLARRLQLLQHSRPQPLQHTLLQLVPRSERNAARHVVVLACVQQHICCALAVAEQAGHAPPQLLLQVQHGAAQLLRL